MAYVRFASVYRKFEDVAEFEAELERLEAEPPLQKEHLFEPRLAVIITPMSRSVRVRSQATQLPRESGKWRADRVQ